MTTAPTCPFCDASTVECVAQWGGQMITSQWRCEGCGSYFEALRDELSAACPKCTGSGVDPPQ